MKRVVFLILLVIGLSACVFDVMPVDREVNNVEEKGLVHPESDNEFSWSFNPKVEVSTQVYKLTVRVEDRLISHTEHEAYGSGGIYGSYGYMTYRMEQSGKGILPVRVLKISPDFPGIMPEDLIILKTTDLKAMALPTGAEAQFVCNEDIEVVSPNIDRQILTTDRLTRELDDCRMLTPVFLFDNRE